ncbi:MAG: alpha/beta fold hydrolase [Burkholderiales bacterium]
MRQFPIDDVVLNSSHLPKATVSQESVTIRTRDQHLIGGTLFRRAGSSSPQSAVVLTCGAGISARYYRRFAEHLASEDIATLTYDYRGIGTSRRGTLRGFHASFEDWAEHDCTAAIDFLTDRFSVPTFGVSHSIGALVLGGALNASKLRGMVMIAPHTGYVGDYRRTYIVPMALMWHGIMPALTALLGYFPGRRLHLGEDIPRDVALAWARRRNPKPGASRGARTQALINRLTQMHAPALAVTISDDGFATRAGAERAMALYRGTTFAHIVISPQQAHTERLGHSGFFRTESLWPLVVTYLRQSVEHPNEVQEAPNAL